MQPIHSNYNNQALVDQLLMVESWGRRLTIWYPDKGPATFESNDAWSRQFDKDKGRTWVSLKARYGTIDVNTKEIASALLENGSSSQAQLTIEFYTLQGKGFTQRWNQEVFPNLSFIFNLIFNEINKERNLYIGSRSDYELIIKEDAFEAIRVNGDAQAIIFTKIPGIRHTIDKGRQVREIQDLMHNNFAFAPLSFNHMSTFYLFKSHILGIEMDQTDPDKRVVSYQIFLGKLRLKAANCSHQREVDELFRLAQVNRKREEDEARNLSQPYPFRSYDAYESVDSLRGEKPRVHSRRDRYQGKEHTRDDSPSRR